MLIRRIVKRLGLGEQNVTSAEQIWKFYDEILCELASDMGKDVSEVIRFQSPRNGDYGMHVVSALPAGSNEKTGGMTRPNQTNR